MSDDAAIPEGATAGTFLDLGLQHDQVILRLVDGGRETLFPMSAARACQIGSALAQLAMCIDPEVEQGASLPVETIRAGMALNAREGGRS